MLTVWKILAFEVKERFKQPIYGLFCALMVFQSIWFLQGSYKIHLNEATFMNASAALYRSLAGGGIVMTIVIAVVTGVALHKDLQYKSAEMIYSASLNDKSFFVGRFLSAYVINLALGFCLVIGHALAPYSGIGDADKFGPMPLGQALHGYFLQTAGNVFIYTAISLSFLVFFRRISACYLSIFAITLLYFMLESVRENVPNPGLLALLDPSTYIYTTMTIESLPANEQNYSYLALGPVFFINRALWLGGSALLLWCAYRHFSFKRFLAPVGKEPVQVMATTTLTPSLLAFSTRIPQVALNVSGFEYCKKMLRLASLDFKNETRGPGFRVLLVVLTCVIIMNNMFWNESYHIGSHHFLTSTVTMTRISTGSWIMIILMIRSTELLFRDRTLNLWQIHAALPVPTWTVLLSKFMAMAGVSLCLYALLALIGLCAQIVTGAYDQIDLFLYVYDFFGYNFGWLTFVQILAYVFFFAGITGNRYATHGIAILYFFFNMISIDLEIIEQLRFTYPFTPGIQEYSQLNGYGVFQPAAMAYFMGASPFGVGIVR